jgi:hypothetical protein
LFSSDQSLGRGLKVDAKKGNGLSLNIYVTPWKRSKSCIAAACSDFEEKIMRFPEPGRYPLGEEKSNIKQ